jgi:hypothetical protein
MLKQRFLAGLLILAAGLANAQIAPAPPELKELDFVLGDWSGKVKYTMEGQPMEGVITWKVEKDGLFLKQTTVTELSGMKLTETAFVGWDAKKKKYSCHTFTSFSPIPRVEWGEVKGGKAVFTSEPWDAGLPGGPVVGRGTAVRQGSDILFTLEFKNGEKWEKVGESLLKRVK